MKRKTIICTIILSALVLTGCTNKASQGAENSSASNSAAHSTTDTLQSTVTPDGNGTQSAATDDGNATQSTATHDGAGTQSTAEDDSNATQSTDHTQPGATQNSDDGQNMISEAEAKQIALTHAGLTDDQVTFIKSGIDRDDGRINYDIEFYTKDNKEYDYEIDPYTGEILDYDYDAEYYPHSTAVQEGKTITEAEAKKIALDKITGAADKDIREFKSEYDNGKLIYEGKIYFEQKEYEFEIDGSDGTILEWDVENIYG